MVEATDGRFHSGRAGLNSRIGRARALYTFSNKLSAAVLAQYSAAEKALSFNSGFATTLVRESMCGWSTTKSRSATSQLRHRVRLRWEVGP